MIVTITKGTTRYHRPDFRIGIPQLEIVSKISHTGFRHVGTLLEGDDLAPPALPRELLNQFVDDGRDFLHQFLEGAARRRMQNAPLHPVLDLVVYLGDGV